MSRVLVVDDDATVREVVVDFLGAAGHDVQEAIGGDRRRRGPRVRPPEQP